MDSNILILIALVLLSAFFSASEIALISLSKSKVNDLVGQKASNSKTLKTLKNNPHRILITVLIGNNIVNIAASSIAAVIFTEKFGSSGIGIATGVMTFVILVFGEITPKSFAQQHAEGLALFVAKPVYFLQILLFPIVWLFEKLVSAINHFFGSKKTHTVTEGEIVAMLKIGAKEGSIEKHEKELIENVLEFNDIQVEEIMTPRIAIEALNCNMTIQEAVDFVIKHTHTRIPVYKDNIDHITGVISIKDLLKYFEKYRPHRKLSTLDIPPPLEVPLSKKINNLFGEFQRRHIHMAIVIDEHGGTAGVVTLEDLLEEIVGEIVDEFDVAEKPIEIVDPVTIIAKGTALIEDINDFFRIKLGNNDRDTLNAMIIEHLHRFPREGEKITFPSAKMKILKMKKNIVDTVRITKIQKKSS